jgi:hypothetical protein
LPFLVSLLGAIFILIQILTGKGTGQGIIPAFLIFGVLAAYLFRLLLKSFKPESEIISVESGSEEVRLSWSGKEPGYLTYATYLLLGPLAFLLFNRGKYPKFPHPPINVTARKRIPVLFLVSTYVVLFSGAVVLFGNKGVGIWFLVGIVSALLVIPLFISSIGIFIKMAQRNNPKPRI